MILSIAYRCGNRFPLLRRLFAPTWRWGRSGLWQIRQRIWPKSSITISFGQGTIKMAPDGQIAEMLWGTLFESEQRDFICRYAKNGMTVINVGANSGLYTLLASKLVRPEGVVYAFEPSTENYNRLKRNLELNACQNVVPQQMALSDFKGTLSLRFDPKNPQLDGHFYVEKRQVGGAPENTIEVVQCETLDAHLRDVRPNRSLAVDIIVIDVEGAELEVFRGALETFAHSPGLAIYFDCTQ